MTTKSNPLKTAFKTPHQTPPFDSIRFEHFEEAIMNGLKLAEKDIADIVNNPDEPTFENVIVALDRSGTDLDRTLGVFYPLLSAEADDAMMELSVKLTPKLSDFNTSIILNRELWKKIKHVWEHKADYNLDKEDSQLLAETYNSFCRSGANLNGGDREMFRQLSAQISELTTRFGQNVQKELATYKIWLTADDLEGLPQSLIESAKASAEEAGRPGEYLFTLEQPTYFPFMKYSSRRDLREKMYRLYSGRNTKGEYSNSNLLKEIANLRLRLANLLGFETFAHYKLSNTMATTPANVINLLDKLKEAYRNAMKKELEEIKQFAREKYGFDETLMPWDYSYFANQLKNERYSFDEESLRPYFELSNTIKGVFGLASRLYGLKFVENHDIPVYHPDVKAYEVFDGGDDSFLGILFADFFPRESKRPGAWMTEFKEQWNYDGQNSRPQVSVVMNFTKPTPSKPSCLTPSEVETFLHEFGHALHGLLSMTKHKSLSGTNVYRDFVELPSQFNENFMRSREFLDSFAKHYITGEPIPDELMQKFLSASRFGAAYACYRQLNFGYLDMAWHSITEPFEGDVAEFESEAGAAVAMFPAVDGALISPQFSHIFAGGYAAGYYSYKWAEVLEADAVAAFEESGIFNRETASRFRNEILSKGGSETPDRLYRNFRGRDAGIEALLHRDQII